MKIGDISSKFNQGIAKAQYVTTKTAQAAKEAITEVIRQPQDKIDLKAPSVEEPVKGVTTPAISPTTKNILGAAGGAVTGMILLGNPLSLVVGAIMGKRLAKEGLDGTIEHTKRDLKTAAEKTKEWFKDLGVDFTPNASQIKVENGVNKEQKVAINTQNNSSIPQTLTMLDE